MTLLAMLWLGTPAQAEYLAGYYAQLGRADLVNSKGVPLRKLGEILHQDRANFHRFGIRQEGDEDDPFFADPAARSRMQDLYRVRSRDAEIEALLAFGGELTVRVQICGRNGQPTALTIVYEDDVGLCNGF